LGIAGVGSMTEFFVFIYAMLASFVIMSMRRNQRLQRPNGQMMTMVGWGLFSLSSTLAVLMLAFAVALALGANVSLAGLAVPTS
jgi:hypothetical protein